MDSLGTAEAVVTVSERVAPRAAAGFGMSWDRTADSARWAMVSGFPHCGRLLDGLRACPELGGTVARPGPGGLGGAGRSSARMDINSHVMPGVMRTTVTAGAACVGTVPLAGAAVGLLAPVLRSDVPPRDDILADRYDAIYRGRFLSRVREVA